MTKNICRMNRVVSTPPSSPALRTGAAVLCVYLMRRGRINRTGRSCICPFSFRKQKNVLLKNLTLLSFSPCHFLIAHNIVIVTDRGLDVIDDIPDLTSTPDSSRKTPTTRALALPKTPKSMDEATKKLVELFKLILHMMFMDKVWKNTTKGNKKMNNNTDMKATTKTIEEEEEAIPELNLQGPLTT